MKSAKVVLFLNQLNDRFGVYLDSMQGFLSNHRQFLQRQEQAKQEYGFSIEQQDAACIIRSNHPPSSDLEECSRREKHRMTQRQYKQNNAAGGLNHCIALEDCLCAIYNLWDEFKKCVLKKGGMPDEKIMPIMKYLNDVRDRLTHNRNLPDQGRARIVPSYQLKHVPSYTLPSFVKVQTISLSGTDLEAIIEEIRKELQIILEP